MKRGPRRQHDVQHHRRSSPVPHPADRTGRIPHAPLGRGSPSLPDPLRCARVRPHDCGGGRAWRPDMKEILATFDESPFSEATIPVLAMLAALPDVEIDLRSVAEITAARDDDAIGK